MVNISENIKFSSEICILSCGIDILTWKAIPKHSIVMRCGIWTAKPNMLRMKFDVKFLSKVKDYFRKPFWNERFDAELFTRLSLKQQCKEVLFLCFYAAFWKESCSKMQVWGTTHTHDLICKGYKGALCLLVMTNISFAAITHIRGRRHAPLIETKYLHVGRELILFQPFLNNVAKDVCNYCIPNSYMLITNVRNPIPLDRFIHLPYLYSMALSPLLSSFHSILFCCSNSNSSPA